MSRRSASKMARTAALLGGIVIGLAAGCQQRPDVVVPTLAQLPTVTPTETASRTPLPTWTFTPTNTLTPTTTPTLTDTASMTPTLTVTSSLTPTRTPTATSTPTTTATRTLLPTISPVPSNTLRPTLTHTNTRTFTPSPSYTPLPSATPVPSATPLPSETPLASPTTALPQIMQFSANFQSVTPNSPITLTWQAVADAARIDFISEQGQLVQSFAVATSGSYSAVVPGTFGRTVTFRLVVVRGGIEQAQPIFVNVVCPAPWFFGDASAISAGCASAPAQQVAGVYQQFERGFMMAFGLNGQQFVFGLANDGRYIAYASRWDGATLTPSTPPPGLLAPEGVFNWAYYNTNAPVGSWSAALGWATTASASSTRAVQFETSNAGNTPLYADSPVNAIFYFSVGAREGVPGAWQRVR